MAGTVVFVHGACVTDALWWWSRMSPLLEARGITSVAPELPSCGTGAVTTADLGDLHADAAAVRAAVAAADGPVVLIGHSYGGMVITAASAGAGPKVVHLVYVSSVLADADESLAGMRSGQGRPAGLDIRGGTIGQQPEPMRDFLTDCDPDVVDGALARLARQSLAAFVQPPGAAAWREMPSTYVVCAHDAGVGAGEQRQRAERAAQVVELPTNHFPHLARPDLLTDVLAPLVP